MDGCSWCCFVELLLFYSCSYSSLARFHYLFYRTNGDHTPISAFAEYLARLKARLDASGLALLRAIARLASLPSHPVFIFEVLVNITLGKILARDTFFEARQFLEA